MSQIAKNKRAARLIAKAASALHRKKFKATMTPEGWIVGRKNKRRVA